MKTEIVVNLNGKGFIATSTSGHLESAITHCYAQLQEMIYNRTGILPKRETLEKITTRIRMEK